MFKGRYCSGGFGCRSPVWHVCRSHYYKNSLVLLAKEIMGIRPSSTASSFAFEEEEYCFVFASCLRITRLICIVRLVRLSEAAKGQELFPLSVSHRPSLIASILFIVSVLFCCITAERLFLLCLDLSVLEQTA